mmetsp:Transcript_3685/g.4934  ORF Transcript_3685/g.4934 Transcript_3685/m.4934 type:complete len:207 (-) Transcript_3685:346-966(-)
MVQFEELSFHLEFFSLSLEHFILLSGELLRENLLLIDHDVQVLFRRDQLLVSVVAALLETDHFLARVLQESLSLSLRCHQELTIIHLAVKLSLKTLDGGRRRMAIALCLELLGPEADELFFEDFVLVTDPACFFMRLVALLPHRLDVALQVGSALLQNAHLLARRRLIVIESVHLVVVHFHIAGQVRAPTLVHADFFPQLRVLHLK